MGITMQGDWTLRVKARNAAYAQRFVVSGADSGNGIHDGIVGRSVFVSGRHWTVNVQHRATRRPWRDSAQRIGLPRVDGGRLQVEISANDGGLDNDYDDLVLACSLPISEHDHLLYGSVHTHVGGSAFNPRRDDYVVIDSPTHTEAVCQRHPRLKEVIGKLYPERLGDSRKADVRLTPLVLPTGLPHVAVGLTFESRALPRDISPGAEDDAIDALRAVVKRVPFKALALKAGVGRLSPTDLAAVANARESALRSRSEVEAAPGLHLRFQRYHRSADERQGAPYGGLGLREDLGEAVTDEQGHYIFRFRLDARSDSVHRADQVDERPDVIVQVAQGQRELSFETAPYDNVANLRRIDLCVPRVQCGQVAHVSEMAIRPVRVEPRPDGAASTDRAVFEYVGNTALLVVGPATGQCYRFRRPGATLWVDTRDRASLTAIPGLRPQQAA